MWVHMAGSLQVDLDVVVCEGLEQHCRKPEVVVVVGHMYTRWDQQGARCSIHSLGHRAGVQQEGKLGSGGEVAVSGVVVGSWGLQVIANGLLLHWKTKSMEFSLLEW